jgi:hypothetical protein
MKPEDLPPHSSHEGQSGVKIGLRMSECSIYAKGDPVMIATI